MNLSYLQSLFAVKSSQVKSLTFHAKAQVIIRKSLFHRVLEQSYSENEGIYFHLDSLPAVLTEFVEILFLIISQSQPSESLNITELEQDQQVLEEVVRYIEDQFHSQFINNETIMLSIEEVIALVDRFVKEKGYFCIDTMPPQQQKSEIDSDKNRQQEEVQIKLPQGGQMDQIRIDSEDTQVQFDSEHKEEKKRQIKPSQSIDMQQEETISIQRSILSIKLPSPRFANIQFVKELALEEQHVITLDECFLPSRNTEAQLPQKSSTSLSFKAVIEKSIKDYEKLLLDMQFQDETEKARIESVVEELKKQLQDQDDLNISQLNVEDQLIDFKGPQTQIGTQRQEIIEDQDLIIDVKKYTNLSVEEQKLQNLQEIFLIYCRQHVMIGKNPTFEDIKKEVRNLNLGEFLKFAKDFGIAPPLTKQKVTEVFKRTALYSREMYFSHFRVALVQLMKEENKQLIDELKKEYKEVKFALRKAQESNGSDDTIQQLQLRAKKITHDHQQLRLANEDDEALYTKAVDEVIEVSDPNTYRKKIKGFTLAFGIRDKQERLQELVSEGQVPINKPVTKISDNLTFKPFLFKDHYRNKVRSVVRSDIQHHQAKHTDRSLLNQSSVEGNDTRRQVIQDYLNSGIQKPSPAGHIIE